MGEAGGEARGPQDKQPPASICPCRAALALAHSARFSPDPSSSGQAQLAQVRSQHQLAAARAADLTAQLAATQSEARDMRQALAATQAQVRLGGGAKTEAVTAPL